MREHPQKVVVLYRQSMSFVYQHTFTQYINVTNLSYAS